MTIIKAYTDLKQSEDLMKYLPISSADMYYEFDWDLDFNTRYKSIPIVIEKSNHFELYSQDIPCWSLAALFTQIPSDVKTKDGCNYTLEIEKCDAEHLPCGLSYHDTWGRCEDIITHYYDNFIDACYEMIIHLHEQKLI